jgi:hypothetical protein
MVTGSFDVGNSIMFLRMSWAIKDPPRSDACHIGWLAMMSRFIEARILRILIKSERSSHAMLRVWLAELEPPDTENIRPCVPKETGHIEQ